ncbi:hypothetical protein [Prevotellamassilia timonensis]|mgnify:FL=1|uniref:hypothetical protein n=1 Tax=Prevotellamassilia timonensis TaxID=1852370 RepID=UPI002587F4BE|nr:hypothetical protein [uncultured Prevotellamassilia sp.]
MNAIKRVAHAFKHTYNATLVRSIAYLIGLFYFVVANDLFWTGNADWNTPLMTVLFNAPIFVFAAATVCTFVYYYTKEKACNDFTATTSSSNNNHANGNAEADEQ